MLTKSFLSDGPTHSRYMKECATIKHALHTVEMKKCATNVSNGCPPAAPSHTPSDYAGQDTRRVTDRIACMHERTTDSFISC